MNRAPPSALCPVRKVPWMDASQITSLFIRHHRMVIMHRVHPSLVFRYTTECSFSYGPLNSHYVSFDEGHANMFSSVTYDCDSCTISLSVCVYLSGLNMCVHRADFEGIWLSHRILQVKLQCMSNICTIYT